MNIKTAERLNSVQEYFFSTKLREIQQLREHGKEIINLGIGSPDLPPHPDVISSLQQSASHADHHKYQGYSGIPELRQAIASWMNRHFNVQLNPNNQVLPLMGSKEGVMHISMALLEEGDTALIPNPGYPTYQAATQLAGASVRFYNLNKKNNYIPSVDYLESLVDASVKIMWLNYPHMPTGGKIDYDSLAGITQFANRNNIILCHDNPYAFILNRHPLSILQCPSAVECSIELHSLSKSYNMAGWRVGAIVGNEEILQNVLRFLSNMNSGMFRPIQDAAITALQLPAEWFTGLNKTYTKRRQILYQMCEKMGCVFQENTSGLFVWAEISSKFKDGFAFSDYYLHEKGVFITPGGIFGSEGSKYIRLSLCSSEEVLLKALKRIKQ